MTHIDIDKNKQQSSVCHICMAVATHSLTAHQGADAIEIPLCTNHGVRLSQVLRL